MHGTGIIGASSMQLHVHIVYKQDSSPCVALNHLHAALHGTNVIDDLIHAASLVLNHSNVACMTNSVVLHHTQLHGCLYKLVHKQAPQVCVAVKHLYECMHVHSINMYTQSFHAASYLQPLAWAG